MKNGVTCTVKVACDKYLIFKKHYLGRHVMVVLKLATQKKTFGWQWIIWGNGKRID